MARLFDARKFRRSALSLAAAVALVALATPSQARGPEIIADVAERVIDAVVNISTSQTAMVLERKATMAMRRLLGENRTSSVRPSESTTARPPYVLDRFRTSTAGFVTMKTSDA